MSSKDEVLTIRPNDSKPLISGSCFLGHSWTKWQQYNREMYNVKFKIQFYELRQKRVCIKCNKMQDEAI